MKAPCSDDCCMCQACGQYYEGRRLTREKHLKSFCGAVPAFGPRKECGKCDFSVADFGKLWADHQRRGCKRREAHLNKVRLNSTKRPAGRMIMMINYISIRRPAGRMILMNLQLVVSMQRSLAFRVYRSFLYVQRWQRQRDARQRDWMTRMRTATTSAHGWGVYYGYPTCCTDSFAMFQNDHRLRSIEQVMVARGGLVPCSTHAEQILNGEIHIADLIKDRICNRRFGPRTTDGPLSRKAWEERIEIWLSYNRECTEGTNQTSTVKLIKN